MSDYIFGLVLVLGKELLGSRECYLVYIFFDIVGCHAYTVVAYGQCSGFLVDSHFYIHIAKLAFEFTE